MADASADTATNKIKTSKEAEAEWWDDWFDADFSWQGLADKDLTDFESAASNVTLQDYWRFDPVTSRIRTDEELIALKELVPEPAGEGTPGRLWHIAQVPLNWQDGTPAKNDWDEDQKNRFRTVIDTRLKVASESPVDHIEPPRVCRRP